MNNTMAKDDMRLIRELTIRNLTKEMSDLLVKMDEITHFIESRLCIIEKAGYDPFLIDEIVDKSVELGALTLKYEEKEQELNALEHLFQNFNKKEEV